MHSHAGAWERGKKRLVRAMDGSISVESRVEEDSTFTVLLKGDEDMISMICGGYRRKPVSRSQLIRELMRFLSAHDIDKTRRVHFMHHVTMEVRNGKWKRRKGKTGSQASRVALTPIFSYDHGNSIQFSG